MILQKFTPMTKKRENNFLIIVECLYTVILLGFLFLALFHSKMSRRFKYYYHGFMMIALIIGVILVHIIYGIIGSLGFYKRLYRKMKKWYKNRTNNQAQKTIKRNQIEMTKDDNMDPIDKRNKESTKAFLKNSDGKEIDNEVENLDKIGSLHKISIRKKLKIKVINRNSVSKKNKGFFKREIKN